MKKKYIITVILIFITIPASAENDNHVTINILSKQIRLLSEKKLSKILFKLPQGTIIENRNAGIFYNSDHLRISKNNEEWIFNISEHHLVNTSITGSCPDTGNTFKVKLPDEIREYPLPFRIIIKNNVPQITVSEEIKKFSIDSAIAEYGRRSPTENEALKALTHIILARSIYRKKNKSHNGFDFCDLTHCQVYRGRQNSNFKLNDTWRIATDGLSDELLFHSRCGGVTYNCQVMGKTICSYTGVKDILYREGTMLCNSQNSKWEREIIPQDIKNIFNINTNAISLKRDDQSKRIIIYHNESQKKIDMESFRLNINRVKGWNFLKSNNYIIKTYNTSKKLFHFSGVGLGHGIGLCQHGALELSRNGYSRFEILEHYYPFIKLYELHEKNIISPYNSYCIFDINTGEIEFLSNPALTARKFPPGSIWKLIVSFYLAIERQDIFREYRYNCSGSQVGRVLPEKCWNPEGHGNINICEALPNSCNLYFGSLYKYIDYKKFRHFYMELCKLINKKFDLPEIYSDRDWAFILSGLDFQLNFSINELIKIAGILYPAINKNKSINQIKQKIPESFRLKLFKSLHATFQTGTAKTMLKEYPDESKYTLLKTEANKKILKKYDESIWGKTSTVIDGTNKPLSYGIFLGGKDDRGIIVILRKGSGHLASQWARILITRPEY